MKKVNEKDLPARAAQIGIYIIDGKKYPVYCSIRVIHLLNFRNFYCKIKGNWFKLESEEVNKVISVEPRIKQKGDKNTPETNKYIAGEAIGKKLGLKY